MTTKEKLLSIARSAHDELMTADPSYGAVDEVRTELGLPEVWAWDRLTSDQLRSFADGCNARLVTFPPTRWNPYFVAYATAHGRSVTDMKIADRLDWPGGPAVGYQLWMMARWSKWRGLHGYHRDEPLWPNQHAAFAGWLQGTAFRAAESLTGPVSSRLPMEQHLAQVTKERDELRAHVRAL